MEDAQRACWLPRPLPADAGPRCSLPPRGYTRRVETLRRHLVDDALSALDWLSRQREPFPPACNQMQDACVARVDSPACTMLGPGSTEGVPTSAQPMTVVLDLPQWPPSVFRSFRSQSVPRVLSMLPDLAGRYLREPERMVSEAMLWAQVLPLAPEPYFDPVLTHRRLWPRAVSFAGSPRDGAFYPRTKRKSRSLCGPQR